MADGLLSHSRHHHLHDRPRFDAIIVALPPDLVDDPPEYLRSAALRQAQGIPSSSRDEAFALHGFGKPLRIVAGGERRQDSVANAFRATAEASDVIVIHDAPRPFASADLIARTIAAAAESGAAVAAVQSRDTVKEAALWRGTSGPRVVRATLPRETIYLAQTPQAFQRDVPVSGDGSEQGPCPVGLRRRVLSTWDPANVSYRPSRSG